MSDPETPVERSVALTPAVSRKVGRYVLHYLLGRGGMGSVYLSRLVGAEGFERWVAVKQLHEHLADDPNIVSMFLDEARTSARLSHPNVVQVTDFGVEGRAPYLVMEYVSGENLSVINRRCRKRGTPLPIPLSVRVLAWACEGLHHAHELKDDAGQPMGLVHRDVSPQNVLVSYDGVVKVTDFGIAKVAHRAGSLTKPGQLKGKAAYMAPEQVQGLPIDRRADVFALGIVLYEATTGRRLFQSDNEFESLRRIKDGDITSPRIVDKLFPEGLEQIVLRALATRAEDRYQTAREMQRDLEQFLGKSGDLVGSAELADFMEETFADRRKTREERLRAVPSSTSPRPSFVPNLDTPVSMTGVPPMVPGGSLFTAPGSRRRPWTLLAAVAAAALCLGGLTVWLFVGSSIDAEGVVGASVGAAGPIGDAGPAADAGRPARAIDAGGPAVAPAAGDVGPAAVAAETGAAERPAPTKGHRQPPPSGPPGTLSIMATPWCDVYLDGRSLGRTPIIRRQVPSGRHSLRLLPLGQGPPHRRSIVVRPGEETPINVTLGP
jgi:serine/threonine-protein kinase